MLEDVGGDVDLGDLDPGRVAVADVSPLSDDCWIETSGVRPPRPEP